MIDRSMRAAKDRLVRPLVARMSGRVRPLWLTALSLIGGVGGGVLAAFGFTGLALVAWLMGRWFDALDGAIARASDEQTDLGGYLDMLADTVG